MHTSARELPTKPDDLTTMDFLILRSVVKHGITEEKVLLILLDVFSDFVTAVPLARRSAKHLELAIIQHAG